EPVRGPLLHRPDGPGRRRPCRRARPLPEGGCHARLHLLRAPVGPGVPGPDGPGPRLAAVDQGQEVRLLMTEAQDWIEALQLQPHPEGGFFRETYRSPETIAREHLPPRFSGDRSFATAIYFLLRGTDFSALHTIKQDEVWHFYEGGSLTVYV